MNGVIQLHPYFILLTFSTLVTLVVLFITRQRTVPETASLKGMLLGMMIWGFLYSLSWAFVPLPLSVLALRIMYVGVVMVPGLFFLFVLRIIRRDSWVTSRNIALLFLEPAAILLIMLFAPEFIYSSMVSVSMGGYTIVQVGRGPGFWINTIYSYFVIMWAVVLLLGSYRNANVFFKKQYQMILLGVFIPFIFSVYSQFKNLAFNDFDLVPVSFGLTSIVYAFAIYRYQLMVLLPVAHNRLIESMSDGVVVLDAQGHIVDINPAMRAFLDADPVSFIGRHVSDVMNIWDEGGQLFNGAETRAELQFPHQPSRYLDLRVSSLLDDSQRLTGRIMVFRDVTVRKEVETNLRNANEKLQVQLIEIGLLQNQLREQAIRDPLTDLFNRRYFDETLERELARASREKYPLCIVMMDIDHFKKVNDTYGHEAGDIVLKKLGELVIHHCRQGDFVCRFGGEEFVLVMPNINVDVARERTTSILETVHALTISYGIFSLNMTLSMGISHYPGDSLTSRGLARAADKALYAAKNNGRNQIVLFRDLNEPDPDKENQTN